MSHTFTFSSQHLYDTSKTGITIPVELIYGSKSVQPDAKLDTGASFCIFARAYADLLDIDVESGVLELVSTATGTFRVFGHRVIVVALGLQFDTTIYFASDENIKRNVLGRRDWIDQIRLCLIEHDGELYISQYDDN